MCYINVLIIIIIYFLTHLFPELFTPSRVDPFHYQAGGCRRRPNLALVFYVNFMLWYILLWMHVSFCLVRFSFSVLSQEIGWEEPLEMTYFMSGGT